MKKKTTITLLVVTMLIMFLSAGPVIAKMKRIDFQGTRCRSSIEYETVEEEIGGRLKLAESESAWQITTGNELVDGVWLNYDTKFDRALHDILQVPPFYVLGNGFIVGRVMIIPDAVNGYWEGNFQWVFYGDDNFTHAVLNGKGNLTGLKLVIDMRNAAISENGILCDTGGGVELYGHIIRLGKKWNPSFK